MATTPARQDRYVRGPRVHVWVLKWPLLKVGGWRLPGNEGGPKGHPLLGGKTT